MTKSRCCDEANFQKTKQPTQMTLQGFVAALGSEVQYHCSNLVTYYLTSQVQIEEIDIYFFV